jgi:hypothetical protein
MTTQILACARYTGDLATAKLLSPLVSWSRKAHIRRGPGRPWNAHTGDDLLAMGGGRTPKQFRRQRGIMIACDAVEFRVGIFNGKTLCPHSPDRTVSLVPPGRGNPLSGLGKFARKGAQQGSQQGSQQGAQQGILNTFCPSALLSFC